MQAQNHSVVCSDPPEAGKVHSNDYRTFNFMLLFDKGHVGVKVPGRQRWEHWNNSGSRVVGSHRWILF